MLPLAALARVATLLAAAAASALDPPPAGADGAAVDFAREWTEPPAGSPEDRALYRAGNDVTRQVTLVRLEARKLQWRARERRYESRLDALRQAAGDPRSERAGALLARWREVAPPHHATLMRQWPVDPTRGCSYHVLHLGGVMGSDGPRKAAQLAVVRADLQGCVERARPAVQAMAAANAQLQAVCDDADALLPPIVPAAPARAPAAAAPAR
jgi:hypothetical protein